MYCIILCFIFLASLEAQALSCEDVRFLMSSFRGVIQYNCSNLNTFDSIYKSTNPIRTFDYHLSKNLLFFVSGTKLYKTRLDQVTGSTLVGSVSRCFALAVDWVHDRVYLADYQMAHSIIKSMDINGENETMVIASRTYYQIRRIEIDPYHGTVFWLVSGVIESCDLMGKNFQTNMSTMGVKVSAFALDLDAQRVYYIGRLEETWTLYSMNYEGRASQKNFSAKEMKHAVGIGIVSGKIYWANYGWNNFLYMASLQDTSEQRVKMLKAFNQPTIDMKVIHPDIQKHPKLDLCQDRGCEYRCVIQNSRAICECPEGQVTGVDGSKCLEESTEQSVTSDNGNCGANDRNEHTIRDDTTPTDIDYTVNTIMELVNFDDISNGTYIESTKVYSSNNSDYITISIYPEDNGSEIATVEVIGSTEDNYEKKSSRGSKNFMDTYTVIAIIISTMLILTGVGALLYNYWATFPQGRYECHELDLVVK